MKLNEMHKEPMHCLIAPNGDPQVTTLAEDMPGCFAITKLLAKAGYGKTPEELISEGFRIMPVSVTITQSGPIDEVLNRALMKPKGIKPKL